MVLIVLFFIAVFAWLVWLIGYPIYKKLIKKNRFDWHIYAMWLNVGAFVVSVINLLHKIVG